jgi:death-on-curing protein
MYSLTLEQVLILHKRIIDQSGGSHGIRDQSVLESALAQPFMSYDRQELYSSLIEKTNALGFSLINNHPFVDGNKRIGHAAIEVVLLMNGYEIEADVEIQEAMILAVAAGEMNRESFLEWLKNHVVQR